MILYLTRNLRRRKDFTLAFLVFFATLLMNSSVCLAFKQLVVRGMSDPRSLPLWIMRDKKLLEAQALKFDGRDATSAEIFGLLEGNKLEGLAVIDGSAYIDWVSSLVENRKSVAVSFVAGVLDRSRFVAYVKKDLGKISETSKVAFLPQDGSKILSAVLRTRLLERVPLEPFSNPVLSTNPVFAAENKEADAIVLSSVNLAMFSSQLRKAAFSPRAEITLPGFFGPVVVGLVSYLDKEPKTVASFIASLRTATRILLEDASGSIKTLRNQLKSDERTANEIYKSLVRAEPITSVRFNESYATSGVEFLLRLGLRPPIKAEDLIMTEPTRNIYKLLR